PSPPARRGNRTGQNVTCPNTTLTAPPGPSRDSSQPRSAPILPALRGPPLGPGCRQTSPLSAAPTPSRRPAAGEPSPQILWAVLRAVLWAIPRGIHPRPGQQWKQPVLAGRPYPPA